MGEPPDPMNIPDGCRFRFRNRCSLVADVRAREDPAFPPVGPAQAAACHFVRPATGRRNSERKGLNEFVVGWIGDEVAVTVPDLICVMDSASGEAIGTETVRYGQRVTVIALPAPPILLTEKGLKHVGPRAFGHDLDFRSVFVEGGQ